MILNSFILKWWSPLDANVGGEKSLTGTELFIEARRYTVIGYEIEVRNAKESIS